MNSDKIWTKGFSIVTISHSIFALGGFMLMPTIPLFLVALGAVESQVGVVVTAYNVSCIVSRFLINSVLEKIGKKRVMIAGLILSTIIMAIYGKVESIGAVAALRVIQGMGLGTTSAIAATMAADFLPDKRRGQGIGYFSMGVVVAMTIAPAIGLYMRDNYGFMPMFLVAACAHLMAAIMASFTREPDIISEEQQREAQQEKREEKTGGFQWRSLYDRSLIVPSVIVLLFGICRSVDLVYIALFAEERNLGHLSWYFAIQTITMFCVRLVVGRFADRKGRNLVLIPGGFAMLAALFTLSLANTSAIMLLGSFFCGLGVGVLAPNLQVWVLNAVEPARRNVASASYYSFMDIGSAIGAPLMGIMAEHFGYTVMFRVGACVALLYIVCYFAIGREKKVQ